MEEVAAACGGFHYEIPCVLGKRVPRVYLRDGQVVGCGAFRAMEEGTAELNRVYVRPEHRRRLCAEPCGRGKRYGVGSGA